MEELPKLSHWKDNEVQPSCNPFAGRSASSPPSSPRLRYLDPMMEEGGDDDDDDDQYEWSPFQRYSAPVASGLIRVGAIGHSQVEDTERSTDNDNRNEISNERRLFPDEPTPLGPSKSSADVQARRQREEERRALPPALQFLPFIHGPSPLRQCWTLVGVGDSVTTPAKTDQYGRAWHDSPSLNSSVSSTGAECGDDPAYTNSWLEDPKNINGRGGSTQKDTRSGDDRWSTE
jgi:hypothetical protein